MSTFVRFLSSVSCLIVLVLEIPFDGGNMCPINVTLLCGAKNVVVRK